MHPAGRLILAVAAITIASGASTLQAQSGPSTLKASVSRLLTPTAVPSAVPSETGLAGSSLLHSAGEAAALTSAVAELFRVPVNLSRFSFSVDNALGYIDEYRGVKYIEPELYYASRMYRISCAIIEF